jgi:polysaccharide export outer membrane protein
MKNLQLSSLIYLTVMAIVSACAPQMPYIWVEDLPKESDTQSDYHIEPGDELHIAVWDQAQITGNSVVRDDGKITVTLVGDIKVASMTTDEAAKVIAKRLEGNIVQNVRVNVVVVKTKPNFVTVIGEVKNPGKIELHNKDNLLDILSECGGFTEFARTNHIYLLRVTHRLQVIRFDYDKLIRSKNSGINFKLRDNDVIIVE